MSQLLGKQGKHRQRGITVVALSPQERRVVLCFFLSSGEERTGKEGKGRVIAKGLKNGQSWTKEVKLGGDS